MTTVVDFKIELNSLSDFSEVLEKVEWNYLKDVGITQVGSYGDIRVAIELLKFINIQFEDVLLLRSESPDLMSQFNEAFKVLLEKKEQMDENAKLLLG